MLGRAQQAPIRGVLRGPKACPTPLGKVHGSGHFWLTSCRSTLWTEVPTYAGASLELLGLVGKFPGTDWKHQGTQRRKWHLQSPWDGISLGCQGKAGGSPRKAHQAILMGAETVLMAFLSINIWVNTHLAAQHTCRTKESKCYNHWAPLWGLGKCPWSVHHPGPTLSLPCWVIGRAGAAGRGLCGFGEEGGIVELHCSTCWAEVMREVGEGYGWYQRSECLPTLSCLCSERFQGLWLPHHHCQSHFPGQRDTWYLSCLFLDQSSPYISQASSRSYSSVENFPPNWREKKKKKKAEIQPKITSSESRLFSEELFLHCILDFLYYCDKGLTLYWGILHSKSSLSISESETSVMHTVRCSSADFEICHVFKVVLGTDF